MRKELTPLPESTADRFNFDHALIVLTELTWLGEPKCLYGETLARLGGWPYHTIANTFCFSCKRFAKFCKEMYEKLGQLFSIWTGPYSLRSLGVVAPQHISNGNRIEWSPIRSVIIRVITKSDDRETAVRYVNHEYDYRLNYMTRCSVNT